MKLIMENWRQFIVESKLVLDESQMKPKFLKEFVLSEDLLEEDKDPQSLSLEELRKMKPQVIINAYNNMKKNETGERITKRISRFKNLNLAVNLAKSQVNQIEFDEKYGAPIMTGFFDAIKKITNAIFKTSFETSKDKAAATRKNHEKAVLDLKQIMLDSYNPLERELFRAIGLFTGANYPTIRNPERFDPEKAKALKFINDGIVDMFKPSRQTYEKAKVILDKLVQTKRKPIPVWRALRMEEKTSSKSKFAGLDAYKKGGVTSVGNLSSFTTDKSVAYGWGGGEGKWRVILHIPKLTRGADVDEFSEFEGEEMEIIVSGEFRISKIETHPAGDESKKQEGNSLQDLLNSPNPPNPEKDIVLITLEDV